MSKQELASHSIDAIIAALEFDVNILILSEHRDSIFCASAALELLGINFDQEILAGSKNP